MHFRPPSVDETPKRASHVLSHYTRHALHVLLTTPRETCKHPDCVCLISMVRSSKLYVTEDMKAIATHPCVPQPGFMRVRHLRRKGHHCRSAVHDVLPEPGRKRHAQAG